MTTNRKSTQLGKFEGVVSVGKGTKGHRVEIHYTRMDGEKPGPAKAGKLAAKVTQQEEAFIKSLNKGDEFVVIKTEQAWTDSAGQPRTTWALDTIAPRSEWKEKEKKTYTQSSSSKSSGYDNLGQQIGNSITNAVASLGAGHTVEEYRQRALELVMAGDWVREQVTKSATTTNKGSSVEYSNEFPKRSSISIPSYSTKSSQESSSEYDNIESAFADLDSLEFPEGL